jgi:hypothetical protein
MTRSDESKRLAKRTRIVALTTTTSGGRLAEPEPATEPDRAAARSEQVKLPARSDIF